MTSSLSRVLFSALLFAPVAAAGLSGCKDDADDARFGPTRETTAIVSYEGYVYVELGASTSSIFDRVTEQQQSAASALRRAHVLLATQGRKLDAASLAQDPVTIVDATKDERRKALRVRYRFRAVARAPATLVNGGELVVGLVQNDTRAAEIAEVCVAPAERDARSRKAPWASFDAVRVSCQKAIAAEQQTLSAARAGLAPNEITPAEFGRMLLPMTAHLRPPRRRDAGAAIPRRASSADLAAPTAEEPPLAGPVDRKATSRALGPDDDDLAADDELLFGGSDLGVSSADGTRTDGPISRWYEPNYYVLVVVGVALLALVRRRRSR